MNKITFVIPSRNNLEFLQLAYKSIRDLETKHEILVLNDASTDDTQKWIDSQNDKDLIVHHNPGPERIGIVGMFDKGIEMARTDIICAFHSDMVVCKDFDKNILKHLEKGIVVSGTRVEPPLHPDGPEKIMRNYGIEVDEFNLDTWYKGSDSLKEDKVTKGIFAPWCMYREDFLAIGGHDELFAPQSKEDSDIFNRFLLDGVEFIQTWHGCVYHMTCRGSRRNTVDKAKNIYEDSPEWLAQNMRSTRNFIRKWGHFVMHDALMKPIVPPKYDIGIILDDIGLVEALEPWCNTIYVKGDYSEYITKEQPNTLYDLRERIKPFDNEKNNEILVEVAQSTFTQQDYQVIQQLSQIIQQQGEPGRFQLGNIVMEIIQMNEYQNNLINI